MQFFHKQKGILTQSGKKFSPTKGLVQLYVDSKGNNHELDGNEVPMSEIDRMLKTKKLSDMEKALVAKFNEIDSQAQEQETEKATQEKEDHSKEMERKHSQILETVQEAASSITEAIKEIPQTVIPELKIPDHIQEQRQWKDQILEALKLELPKTDLQPVIDAIKNIQFPELAIPPAQDYTELLIKIKKALPSNTDLSGVIAAIGAIKPFQIPEGLIKDGRLKVEVDRVSLGGNGGSGLASEETLQALLAASGGSTTRYVKQDPQSTYTYYGFAGTNAWLFKRKTNADSSMMYASGSGDFDTNWADRVTKTYTY